MHSSVLLTEPKVAVALSRSTAALPSSPIAAFEAMPPPLYERSNSGVLVPNFDFDDVVCADDDVGDNDDRTQQSERNAAGHAAMINAITDDDDEEELQLFSSLARRSFGASDDVASPTSSSSNGSSSDRFSRHTNSSKKRSSRRNRALKASTSDVLPVDDDTSSNHIAVHNDKDDDADADDDGDDSEENRFQLAIALDFETDTTPSIGGTPVTGPESATRKTSGSFSDLGDYDDFSLSDAIVPTSSSSATGDSNSSNNSSSANVLGTFYPIYEEDAYRIIHSSIDSNNNNSSSSQALSPYFYSPPKTSSTGGRTFSSSSNSSLHSLYTSGHTNSSGRLTPTLRYGTLADESQPLVGSIYPIAGEVLHMKADSAAYIIFYKTNDADNVDSSSASGLYASSSSPSSSSEESSDVLLPDFGESESTTTAMRPPRSYASLGAAGHKVQTDNCFTRESTHPTRSIGRGLFRASTSVGNAFLKGATGLVHQTYEGGASGGVFGFAKGLGMGMLGLGTHTVKGAFRGVGQVTNLVGEMMLGTAPHFSIDGTLVLTNYRIIWLAQHTRDAMEIRLASIVSLESSTTAPHVANIDCKHLLRASIAFVDEATCYAFLNCIAELYAAGRPHYVFAHVHQDALLRRTDGFTIGATLYDPEADYRRLGLLNEASWMQLVDNSDYALFPSYPSTFVVPSVLDDVDLRALSAYRSASRIPAVVWRHPHTGALMCRCAQPCAGLSGYVVESDQKFVRALQRATMNEETLFHFFDARSQIAATANAAQGKGTEDPRNYAHAALHFCDMANIHAVRSAYHALANVCQPGNSKISAEWVAALGQTMWFGHIARMLATAQAICRCLGQGESAMVHCSDGWDRTPQLTTLVQLLLDPFYRTLSGFLQLVEKEWCSFGHLFRHRFAQSDGPGQQELEEQSPVFVQWIDAVWQIWRQQPWAFEFNEAVLAALYEHVFSGRYGTFLYNCERERLFREREAPTVSLWSVLLDAREQLQYANLEYDNAKNFNSVGLVLPFAADEDDVVLWDQHLLFADPVCRKYQ